MRETISQFSTVIISIVVGLVVFLMIIGIIRLNLNKADNTPTRFGDVLNERTEDMSMDVNSNTAKGIAGTDAAEVEKVTLKRYVEYHGTDLVSSSILSSGGYISAIEVLRNGTNADEVVVEAKETVLAPGRISTQSEMMSAEITRGKTPEDDTFKFNDIGEYVIRYTIVDSNGKERTSYGYVSIKR